MEGETAKFLSLLKVPAIISVTVLLVVFLFSFWIRFSNLHTGLLNQSSLYFSSDDGKTWESSDINGQPVGSINSITDSQGKNVYILGTRGDGFLESADGENWTVINNSEFNQGFVSDIYVDSKNNIWTIFNKGNNIMLFEGSLDGKDNIYWSLKYSVYQANSPVESIAFQNDNIYLTIGAQLLKSSNNGLTWTNLYAFNEPINNIYSAGGNIYAASNDNVYESSNGGNTWSSIMPSSLKNKKLSSAICFYVDLNYPNVLYLSYNNLLLRSTDDGKNWGKIPVVENMGNITALYSNPKNQYNIIVGSASNIYVSYDGGTSWETRNLETDKNIKVIYISPENSQAILLGLR